MKTAIRWHRVVCFTLLELLVVIAIIAILAAMLLPALAKSKTKSQDVACRNHLKQLQTAWLLYADEHNDLMCSNASWGTGTDPLAWGGEVGSWVLGNPQLHASPTNIQSGCLFSYTRALGVYRCPADQSMTVRAPRLPRNRSYALNAHLNGSLSLPAAGRKKKVAQLATPPPCNVFAFLDVGERQINGCDFFVSQDGIWCDVPGDRHSQGAVLSFADGHVERHRWLCPKAKNVIGDAPRSPGDLQDLRWLRERLPRP